MEGYRKFLRDDLRLEMDFAGTDQNMGVDMPPVEKPYPEDADIIHLPEQDKLQDLDGVSAASAIKRRKSRRKYSARKISIEELSYLLWACTGVRKRLRGITFRNVPSAGNRHAVETYLLIQAAGGLKPGIYRYLPLEHGLLPVSLVEEPSVLKRGIIEGTLGQYFTGEAPVVFIWTAIPYRMEWRYGIASHKVIAIDAGHICQNLYIACEVIGAGTCAVAAYNQGLMDELIGVDGKEEFTIYLAPVGKV